MRAKLAGWLVIAVYGLTLNPWLAADDDEHHGGEHGEYRHHEGRDEEEDRMAVPTDPFYEETCGACHMAYPPGFLPESSWRAIVDFLPEHNGETIELDPADRSRLLALLVSFSAERSRAEVSRKILASLDGEAPLAVSDVPYIRRKHREIAEGVFEREKVGGRGRCAACHPGADRGVFEEDLVKVPR